MSFKTGIILLSILSCLWTISGCSGKRHISTPITIDKNAITDVVYGNNNDWKGNSTSLTMDIYSPPVMQEGKKYPLVLFIHGGGYLTGDKKSASDKCSILADSGFIAVSIDYRLGWDKGTGQCNGNTYELENAGYRAIQDANAALRFLVSEADKYSIDTNWIFLSGSSAGAITAICATYLDDNNIKAYYPASANALGSLVSASNNLTNKYSIKGISSISGGIPDTNLIRTGKVVPAILFHGALDETVPPEYGHFYSCANYPYISGGISVYRTIARKNVPVIAHILTDAGHGHDGESGYSDEYKMSETANFFHNLIQKSPQPSGIFYSTSKN
ncbi:MAG TPA: alpha/beta hydrolase [Panacibacter sp.]|nr:alpha/beta hydrolase [Panacibacter sp.]HNP45320.1 alpha/beta hydrolase [Panacibacter sp.]